MSTRTSTLSPTEAYARLREQASAAQKYLLNRKTLMQQPTCDARVIVQLVETHCRTVIARIDLWSVPGLQEVARTLWNDPAYDVLTDIAATRAAYVNLRDTLMQRFPKNANGFLLYEQFTADGSITTRTFTSEELADAIPIIDAVIAALP